MQLDRQLSSRLDQRGPLSGRVLSRMSFQQPLRQPAPKQTVLTFLITIAIFSLVAYVTFFPPSLRRLHRRLPKPFLVLFGRISTLVQPFLSPFEAPNDLAIAIRSFSDYSFAQQRSVDAKWRAFERMKKRHRRWGDRLGWKKKLAEVEDRIEANALVTDELSAMGMEQAKKEGVPFGLRSKLWRQDGRVVEVCASSFLCVAQLTPSRTGS